MPKVAVFGIGPSGMAVGYAALLQGYEVTFFSNTHRKSTLHGCQYLHAEIPLPREHKIRSTKVAYILRGTPEQYRHKVYGDKWTGTVSPEELEEEHMAWDIRATYDALWDVVTQSARVKLIPGVTINSNWVGLNTRELSSYSHVVSTIPAYCLCANARMHPSQEGHLFESHTIKAMGSSSPGDEDDGEIWLDGTDATLWYRSASVFGYRTVEWPRSFRPGKGGPAVATVRKPLQSECDCHPEITRLGRFGEWKKGVLVHQVYERATGLFAGSWAGSWK